ncbi:MULTISPECIES: LEA type 2 family protein [unclassified Thauera]|uniref:LEA type 2 family protein n=1 Tax=unclassified Thauera TaxID=2609274 RepID=UPI0002CE4AD3|nr:MULTISPECIES: LEA type 2 family protein [unclassified Thauera]ENO94246.1 Water stress and Hypersensitive response domain-containing protein [Thauera sp. 28]WBL64426.1 LEA type 2 family protein [Thauera sp. WB-2]HNR60826.1 LEA type 2 family protein [Thauera sp.]HNS91554.1 LEA type 2 family protein [Thauera sp.]HRJ23822.1 LEA type 2 family protein [Thauera sp.]
MHAAIPIRLAHLCYRSLTAVLVVLALLAVGGCASLVHREPVRINVVGLEPIPGEGMEMRFKVRMRVQNPNDSAIDFDGLALELELNGRPFATGVSDRAGSVPRFGETLIEIPVSVSAIAVVRQALGVIEGEAKAEVPYTLRGRLAGGLAGGMRFSDSGTLKLPDPLRTPR